MATDGPEDAQERLLPGAPLCREAEITGRSGLTYRQWLDTGARDLITGYSVQTYEDFLREFALDNEGTLLVAQIRNPATGTWCPLEPKLSIRLDDLDDFVTEMQAVLRDQWEEEHADDTLQPPTAGVPTGFVPLPDEAITAEDVQLWRRLVDEALAAGEFRWWCPACGAKVPMGQYAGHAAACTEKLARHEFIGLLAVLDEYRPSVPKTAEDVVEEIAAGPWDLRRPISLIPLTSRGLAGWKPKKRRKRRRRG